MSWQIPEYYVGDTVLWHDGRDAKAPAHAAIVTGVGRDGIVDLLVLPISAFNGFPKSGVRFHEDPNKQAINNNEDGVWSYTERNARRAAQVVAREKK